MKQGKKNDKYYMIVGKVTKNNNDIHMMNDEREVMLN